MVEVTVETIGRHFADMLKKRNARCTISHSKTLGGDDITTLHCKFKTGNIANTKSTMWIVYLTKSGFIRDFDLIKGPTIREEAKEWRKEHKHLGKQMGLED